MSYVTRTKDNPGDVGRAADQQQSVDNEEALFAASLGPAPVSEGWGVIRQFVKKTGIPDNVATEIATITTANEAGNNDGGVWGGQINGVFVHAGGKAGDNAVWYRQIGIARAMKSTGIGQNAAIDASWIMAGPAESEGGATKGIATALYSLVETSEFVISVRVTVDLDGTAVTTAEFFGYIELIWSDFVTPPVITSAE
jgi:hypothetical protein